MDESDHTYSFNSSIGEHYLKFGLCLEEGNRDFYDVQLQIGRVGDNSLSVSKNTATAALSHSRLSRPAMISPSSNAVQCNSATADKEMYYLHCHRDVARHRINIIPAWNLLTSL